VDVWADAEAIQPPGRNVTAPGRCGRVAQEIAGAVLDFFRGTDLAARERDRRANETAEHYLRRRVRRSSYGRPPRRTGDKVKPLTMPEGVLELIRNDQHDGRYELGVEVSACHVEIEQLHAENARLAEQLSKDARLAAAARHWKKSAADRVLEHRSDQALFAAIVNIERFPATPPTGYDE
jgi:hypothetical protein